MPWWGRSSPLFLESHSMRVTGWALGTEWGEGLPDPSTAARAVRNDTWTFWESASEAITQSLGQRATLPEEGGWLHHPLG